MSSHHMNLTHSSATSPHDGHQEEMFHETGHNGQHMLFFHFNNKIVVLFAEWEIVSTAVLIGSCIAIFVLALLYEGLKQCRERHARHYTRPRPQEEHEECNDTENAVTSNGNAHLMMVEIIQSPQLRIFTGFHFLQTLMHILQAVVGYLLMLVVMTYNVWLCLAVVAGVGLGYFVMAGLLAERVPRTRSRTKKSSSVLVLKKRARKESENEEKVESLGCTTIEITDENKKEKNDEKDDNQNKADEENPAEHKQTGNGTAGMESTGNGSAVVECTDGDQADTANKNLETTSEDQHVEVKFGAENDDSGKENPAFEVDTTPTTTATTTTE